MSESDTIRSIARAGDDPVRAAILEICDPNGVPARTAVVLGSIENARALLARCWDAGTDPERVAHMAIEELGKILRAKDAYDSALFGEPK